MTEGNGDGVRRVEFFGDRAHGKDAPHHELDLLLVRAAIPGDGFLYLSGGVLGGRQLAVHGGENGHASRMADLERGLRVLAVERGLNREFVGPVLLDDLQEAVVDGLQSQGHRTVCAILEHSAGHEDEPAALLLNNAVAGHEGAGVDAEDDHGRPETSPGTLMSRIFSCGTISPRYSPSSSENARSRPVMSDRIRSRYWPMLNPIASMTVASLRTLNFRWFFPTIRGWPMTVTSRTANTGRMFSGPNGANCARTRMNFGVTSASGISASIR